MTSNNEEPKQVDWLVMLYMAGDNNLDHEMVQSLQFLLEVGGLGNDAIVAEFDSSQPGRPTQRYDFTVLNGHRLENYIWPHTAVETSTGNPETLELFIKDAEKKYTAQHRILILSGHGSGTTEDFLMLDENADDFLSIGELKEALKDSGCKDDKKLDIIGMDACYMSMAEVCYELRDHAEILIGAEGIEPEFGWPYSKILRRVHQKRSGMGRALNPEEAAIVLVKEYIEYYHAYDISVDLAAIRLSEMEKLKQEFASLVAALGDQSDKLNKLTSAHWRAQTYKSHQYVDLKDLCDQIDHVDFSVEVETAAEAIVKRLEGAVLQSGCSGFAYQWSHGLSLYFPWAFVSPDYANMEFSKETQIETETETETIPGWNDFIIDFVKDTRREARHKSTSTTPPMSNQRREELARQSARAHAAWATRIPHLKPGDEGGIKRRLNREARKRFLRSIERYEEDGLSADEIAQQLTADISKGGRGSPQRSKGSPQRSKYAPLTQYPEDRGIAIKNFAPVTGVAWWPLEPDVRILQS